MHVITARNVNDAIQQGIRHLYEVGQPRFSRAGEVLVSPYPVMVVYERPTERVLLWPERDANPFFHLFESLWMLAGRNDAAFLDRFIHDFGKRFALSDGNIHGAYGWRWRDAFGQDQIKALIEYLKQYQDGRRAVLQMWDSGLDLDSREILPDVPCNTQAYFSISLGERDRPNRLNMTVTCRSGDIIWGCLSGDTTIQSPEGDISISRLSSLFNLGLRRYPIYAVDDKTGDMRLKWCTNAWKTGNRSIRKLIFDDGSFIKLTHNHILYLRKKGGADVPISKKLIPIRAGDLKVGDRIWAPWTGVLQGRSVIKYNIFENTSFSNLQATHIAYEELLHGPVGKEIHVHHKDENPTNNKSDNLERLTISEHLSHHMRIKMKKMNPKDRRDLAKKGSSAASKIPHSKERREQSSRALKLFWENLSPEERTAHIAKVTKIGLDAAKLVNTRESMQSRGKKGSNSRWKDPEQRRRQSELMKRLNRERKLRSNHKIVEIQELSAEEVYDFTVQDYHTALIGTGVLAHNSFGANAVHFSVLQEYLAARLELDVGKFYHLVNNFHGYRTTLDPLARLQATAQFRSPPDPYVSAEVKPLPIVTCPETFDRDLAIFLEDPLFNTNLSNEWFGLTAGPMWKAHTAFKNKDISGARYHISRIGATDWKQAASQWIERRAK